MGKKPCYTVLSADELERLQGEYDVRLAELAKTHGKTSREYRALNMDRARLFRGQTKVREKRMAAQGERAEFRFRALIASGEAYQQLERAQGYMRRHGMKTLEEIASAREVSQVKCPKCSEKFEAEVLSDPRLRLAALKEISEFAQVIAQATIAMAKTMHGDGEPEEKTVELQWPTEGVKG